MARAPDRCETSRLKPMATNGALVKSEDVYNTPEASLDHAKMIFIFFFKIVHYLNYFNH